MSHQKLFLEEDKIKITEIELKYNYIPINTPLNYDSNLSRICLSITKEIALNRSANSKTNNLEIKLKNYRQFAFENIKK